MSSFNASAAKLRAYFPRIRLLANPLGRLRRGASNTTAWARRDVAVLGRIPRIGVPFLLGELGAAPSNGREHREVDPHVEATLELVAASRARDARSTLNPSLQTPRKQPKSSADPLCKAE